MIKKIIYLVFLIIIKEGYLLIKNLLGLISHPFLTLRSIKAKKDFSQTFLIITTLSAPLAIMATISGIYLVIKYVIGLSLSPSLGFLLKFIDLTATLLLLITAGYLAFWTRQVIKKNHSSFFKKENCVS